MLTGKGHNRLINWSTHFLIKNVIQSGCFFYIDYFNLLYGKNTEKGICVEIYIYMEILIICDKQPFLNF